MVIYQLICVCTLVLVFFGAADGACYRAGIRGFELAYPAIAVLMLAPFRFHPYPEFSCSLAVFGLPMVFILLTSSRTGRTNQGGNTLKLMLLASTLPPVVRVALSISELVSLGYSALDLSSQELIGIQCLSSALMFILIATVRRMAAKRIK